MIKTIFPLVKEAVRSMLLKKQRTFLALLGIIIGIGSVIAMISVGEIVKHEAVKQFEELGTNIISIKKGFSYNDATMLKQRKNITIEVVNDLKNLSSVENFSAHIDLNPDIIIGSKIVEHFSVMGVTPSFFRINKLKIESGRFLAPVDKISNNCVVGDDVESMVKKEKSNVLVLNQSVFKIVGVASSDANVGIRSFDVGSTIFIDIYRAASFLKNPAISQIVVKVKKGITNFQAKKDLRNFFNLRKINVEIHSPDELVAQMEKQLRMFTLLLGAIGSISLLVGGIGIMNVLLVSVSERRKEIGIRRAIGAKQIDIQLQFLIESFILTTVGGILGIVVGIATSFAISKFSDWEFIFSYISIIAGITMSFLVGGFFGFYPARQAAKMDPINALRAE